jgi:malonate decarboxylase delta subunit
METLNFEYEAKRPLRRRAHVGVVGSGDLEVLIEVIAHGLTWRECAD